MKIKRKEFETLKNHVLLLEKRVQLLVKITENHGCKKVHH
jgi:hypothetical protein